MKNTYLLALGLFWGHSTFSSNLNISNTNAGAPPTSKQVVLPTAGASLHFDGVDDVVNAGNSITTALSTKNQLTVEAWVYPTKSSGNGVIVGNYAYPNANVEMQFFLRRDDDNQYVFFLDDNNGYQSVYSGDNTLIPNTWQHVVAMWDGSVISIYIDGMLMKTQTGLTGPHLATTTNSIAIGGNATGQYFEGNIDEVRIWSRAICTSELTADKNCEIPTTAPGLLANYHFNQGVDNDNNSTVTTLTDASGNNNTGTLNNFALTGLTSNWSLKAGVTSGVSCTPYNGVTSVSIASQTAVSCNGKSDGSATLLVNAISPSYSWAPSGGTGISATGLAAGTYTCTVTSACTGSKQQIVTITEPAAITTTQSPVLCFGKTITVGTNTYSATGNYTDVLKAKNGCDSTVITNLTVNPAITFSQSPVLCAGQTITVGANIYNANGTYTDVLKAKNGCDSTVTTILTVNPAITFSQSPVLCAGQTITVGANIYNANGTYTDVLKAKNGCDSTVTTILTVNPAITFSQSPVLCAGQSITVGANIYNASGTYTDVLKAKNGCDSTVTTILTVNPAIVFSQSPVLCAGQSITVGSNIYNATGSYTDVLKAKNGCDSTVTTNLTVTPAIVFSQSFTLCAGQSVTVGTNVYSITGNYTDILTSKNGCDSTVKTHITVNPAIVSSQSPVLCAGQSIVVGTHTYSVSGVYTDVFKAFNGCDSTVTTNLTVLPAVNIGVSVVGNVLVANAASAIYQWIDCNNANTIITGETAQSFTATQSGNYAVIVTESGCSDTSACQQVVITGINNTDANKPAQLYPNPTSGLVSLVLTSSQQVLIVNAIGQVVYNAKLNSGTHAIDLQNQPSGLYTVQLFGNNATQNFKLVKE